jgi:hypothetical protein
MGGPGPAVRRGADGREFEDAQDRLLLIQEQTESLVRAELLLDTIGAYEPDGPDITDPPLRLEISEGEDGIEPWAALDGLAALADVHQFCEYHVHEGADTARGGRARLLPARRPAHHGPRRPPGGPAELLEGSEIELGPTLVRCDGDAVLQLDLGEIAVQRHRRADRPRVRAPARRPRGPGGRAASHRPASVRVRFRVGRHAPPRAVREACSIAVHRRNCGPSRDRLRTSHRVPGSGGHRRGAGGRHVERGPPGDAHPAVHPRLPARPGVRRGSRSRPRADCSTTTPAGPSCARPSTSL